MSAQQHRALMIILPSHRILIISMMLFHCPTTCILRHPFSAVYILIFMCTCVLCKCVCLVFLQSNLEVMGVEEGGVLKEGDIGDVNKFLNRLLGLKLLNQNMVSTNV